MQKTKNKTTPLKVTDFYSAAYLMSIDYELIQVDESKGMSIFIFEDSPEIKKDLANYYTMEGSVVPYKFVRIIKKLKTIIHEKSTYNKINGVSSI